MLIIIVLFICGILLEKYGSHKIPHMNRHFLISASFFFAVVVYVIFTLHGDSMISSSRDAADIWKTITSFHTKNIYGSYVLYKGINSVYPYIWLYDFSVILNVNEWTFIKIFYCGAFAYTAAIGFPNMIEFLTNQETKLYRRFLFVVAMWYFGYYSCAYTQLMVDLPCLMYYVLLINAALKLFRKKKGILRYVWAGLLSGLCMSASGQYTMPAICIAIFIFWITYKSEQDWKKRFQMLLVRFAPFLLCIGLVVGIDFYFESCIVNPLRQEGAWIPTGDDWLQAGLIRFNETYRQGGNASSLPSYRNAAILHDYYGENLVNISAVTVEEYVHIFLKYPMDFILNFLNSFFLILSPDHGSFNFIPLSIFYTLLFCSIYIGLTKCKTWEKIFSPLFFIGFSFLWATVPMLVMNIEPRTCLQIQGLIMSLALCDGTIWENIHSVLMNIQKNGRKEFLRKMNRISYPVLFYIIFLCICLMHIATLYEALGTDTQGILINLK